MKIVVIPSMAEASAFYRMYQPYGYLQKAAGIDIFFYDDKIHSLEQLGKELNLADIVVYQYPSSEKACKLIGAIMRQSDKKRKVIMDYDDNLFEVSPWNPTYKNLGTKEVSVKYSDRQQVKDLMAILPDEERKLIRIDPDGSATMTMWKDGSQDFNIEANLAKRRRVQSTMKEADLLTVTTPDLADQFRKYRPTGKIAILPNFIDLQRFQPMKKMNDGKFRIVWQGGTSHYRDLIMVRLELASFAEKHPEVEYVFMGLEYSGVFHDIKDRIKWVPWHHDINTYPAALSDLAGDVAICPLVDDVFDRGKSPLKWEEMSAMKVPCVCSPCVYHNFIEHGKTGFIAREGEWGVYLEKLLDPKTREEIGQNAYDAVKSKFSLEKATDYWSAIQDMLFGSGNSKSNG